ncbi:hypothetical protein ENBRE01_1813 [Enteropsectra breve]|nr:hypothetical protein ENBRE01_1813 [Enteropsectra breve]
MIFGKTDLLLAFIAYYRCISDSEGNISGAGGEFVDISKRGLVDPHSDLKSVTNGQNTATAGDNQVNGEKFKHSDATTSRHTKDIDAGAHGLQTSNPKVSHKHLEKDNDLFHQEAPLSDNGPSPFINRIVFDRKNRRSDPIGECTENLTK